MTVRPTLKRRALVRARLAVQATGYDVIREPFKHRFLYSLRQHGITAALDVGANIGQFGQEMRRGKFTGRIVSIEPLNEAFDQLRAVADGDPAWTAERAAVSDKPGTVTMNVSGNSVSSSLLPMLDVSVEAAPQTRYVATETVEATTVDELVERHHLTPETSLLKIDVQGFENAVLDGARDTLPRFGAVRLEMSLVPLYEGETLMPEMLARLGENGFDLWDVDPGFTEPGTRRLLQMDGVFFRRS